MYLLLYQIMPHCFLVVCITSHGVYVCKLTSQKIEPTFPTLKFIPPSTHRHKQLSVSGPVLRKVQSPPDLISLELLFRMRRVWAPKGPRSYCVLPSPLNNIPHPYLTSAPTSLTSPPGSYHRICIYFSSNPLPPSADHLKVHEPHHGHLLKNGMIPNLCFYAQENV